MTTVQRWDALVQKAPSPEFRVVQRVEPGEVTVSTPHTFELYRLGRQDALYRRLVRLGEIVEQAESTRRDRN